VKNSITASSSHAGAFRDVDDHRRSRERLVEPFTRQRVDACLEVGGDGVVPMLAELVHELRSDEPATADDDDLHLVPFIV
jgi:hypothetical protein